MFEELEELGDSAEKSEKLNDIISRIPEDISEQEFVEMVGKQIDIKVIESQSPLYDTPEEAKEASEKPELQIIDQFANTVVKQYLKLE